VERPGRTRPSLTAQEGASNSNAPTRVFSDGNDGSVSQSNDASSAAEAGNENSTDQSVAQDLGGTGAVGIQVAGQQAANEQIAGSFSAVLQKGASNHNSPTRVYSAGGGGSVSQSNSAASAAGSWNSNETTQDATQNAAAGGCGCGAIGVQALGQRSTSAQAAGALSLAVQDFGRSECGCASNGNSNSPTRVYSNGDDGSVEQSNDVSSEAGAWNDNATTQTADQTAAGFGGVAVQALGQDASNWQLAEAASAAFQLGASNANSPTRVFSAGNGGSLEQANNAASSGWAGNENGLSQDGSQTLRGSGCGCSASDPQIQALGQSAGNWQAAKALSAALQLAPRNANGPTAVWSPGNAGATLQSNDGSSEAGALNAARAAQLASQLQS